MATEVTKLITVSLGKMQQSRQTKCGPNLRKSLLVASVLHKARDVYVNEVKSKKSMDTNQKPVNKEPVPAPPEPVRKRRFTSQRSLVEDTSTESVSADSTSDISDGDDDSALSKRKCHQPTNVTMDNNDSISESRISTACVSDSVLDQLATESEKPVSPTSDKENSPPVAVSVTSSDDNSKTIESSCGRCLKRRFSTDSHYTTDGAITSTNQDSNQSKRSKTSPADSSNTTSITSDSSNNNQINSLVKIFSRSFPEFAPTSPEQMDRPSELHTFASHLRESIALTA